jgi:hypothetical protein
MRTEQSEAALTPPTAAPRRHGALALAALVLAILGTVLYGFVIVALLDAELHPPTSPDAGDTWFYLTAYGSLGFFPAATGLALGVVALLLARRRGQRDRTALWVVALAGGILAVMVSLVVGWWLFS